MRESTKIFKNLVPRNYNLALLTFPRQMEIGNITTRDPDVRRHCDFRLLLVDEPVLPVESLGK
jgi:hypothetical protein